MPMSTRSVAGALCIIAVTACADVVGYEDDIEFTVRVDQGANVARGMIKNGGLNAIYIKGGPGPYFHLERREDGGWREVGADIPRILPLSFTPVEPDETHSFERPIEWDGGRLPPGEYRYRAELFKDALGDEPLPNDIGISETFRIE